MLIILINLFLSVHTKILKNRNMVKLDILNV